MAVHWRSCPDVDLIGPNIDDPPPATSTIARPDDEATLAAAVAAAVTDAQPLSKDFHRFWASAAASNLGDGIRLGALPLLALSLTDDARLISMVTASTVLPWLLLGPVGGALVDRYDRRWLMMAGQVSRAVLVGVLAILVAVGSITVWVVAALAFALGIGEVLVDSSAQAAIPQLVGADQLDRANGRMIAALTVLDKVVGVTLGALLFSAVAALPFAIDAATFVVGAVLILSVQRPLQGIRSRATSLRADVVGGVRFLLTHPFLRALTAGSALSNMASYASFAVLVVLVVDELGATDAMFGLVLGVGALGGVAGSLAASRLVGFCGRRLMVTAPPFVLVAAFVLHASAPAPWAVALASFIINFSLVCLNVPAQSMRQAVTPEPLLGRVTANFRVFALGAVPVGAVLGGFVTEASGVRSANVAAAGIQVIACGFFLWSLWHLDDAMATVETSAS